MVGMEGESNCCGRNTGLERVADGRAGRASLVGSLADSVLGATLQAVYVCRNCGKRTEDRRHAHGTAAPTLTLVRGVPLMTNDTVNLCASLAHLVGVTR